MARIGQKILAVLKEKGGQLTTRQISSHVSGVDEKLPANYDSVYKACVRLHRDGKILKSMPVRSGEEVVWQYKPDGMIETARHEYVWSGPDVDAATGIELNVIGQSLGVDRNDGEEDAAYRQRIKDSLADV